MVMTAPIPYKKVFICQILKGAASARQDNARSNKQKFNIQGTIISKSVKQGRTVYHIDDGTGVICSVQFHQNKFEREPVVDTKQIEDLKRNVMSVMKGSDGLTKDLSKGMKRLLDKLDCNRSFHLGDIVSILGAFGFYRDMPQIVASICHNVTDPNEESLRILELLHYDHFK